MSKPKKIHFSYPDIEKYSVSDEGTAPLADPTSVRQSSRDPNKGLYPTHRAKRRRVSVNGDIPQRSHSVPTPASAFQTAAALLVKMEPIHDGSQGQNPVETKQGRAKKKKMEAQKNKITSYFSLSPRKSHPTPTSSKCGDSDEDASVSSLASPPCSPWALSKPAEVKTGAAVDSDDSDCIIIGDDFGLTGKHLTEEPCPTNHFDRVPDELLEIILAHLSLQDLLLICSHVCIRWHRVISNCKFLQYRKLYYMYKAGNNNLGASELHRLCPTVTLENCLSALIRLMLNFKKNADGLHAVLSKQHNYIVAMTVLEQSFPDCFTNGHPNLWCLTAMLVLVSESVWDVYAILHDSLTSTVDVLSVSEALYFVATLLFHFKGKLRLNTGLHYRTYYALHLFENSWTGTLKDLSALHQAPRGQQNIMKFSTDTQGVKYTHEQMRIINHDLKPGDVVLIVAFAGTGKTSTLVEYARIRPGMKFLNVVYNKSVEQLAKRTFPRNVECRTAHSLAYGKVGIWYRHKMMQNFKVFDVKDYITRPPITSMPHLCFTKLVIKTIESFVSSADKLITTAHVPSYAYSDEERGDVTVVSTAEALAIVEQAEAFWKRMLDPADQNVRITHDGYLKKFQLEEPDLGPYDCIFVDESQDCNPAMLDFILAQRCPKILVGDPHQQIYAFRNAVDALSSVSGTHKYYLTKSFRFGPEIGYVACCALETLKDVQEKTIVGCTREGRVDGGRVGQIAVIARSNLTLFNEAVSIVCNGRHQELGITHVRAAFVGGFASYRFGQIEDIYRLKFNAEPKRITDPFIKKFSSFQKLYNYARYAEDNDLKQRIEFVEVHGHQVPLYVRTLTSDCKFTEEGANIVFTTAHKAKGLEFDTVIITEDFYVGEVGLDRNYRTVTAEKMEESNVLYVALTRAKKRLVMSRMLYYVLLEAREKFEYLKTEEQALRELNVDALTCCSCLGLIEPSRKLVVLRRSYWLARDEVRGGPLCKSCATSTSFVPLVDFPTGDMLYPQPDWTHRAWRNILTSVL